MDMLNSAEGKILAGLLSAYAGWRWIDGKLLLSHDVDLAWRTLPKMIEVSKWAKQPGFSIATVWGQTYSKINRKKTALVSADTGASYTFQDVEEKSNQIAHWASSIPDFKPDTCVALYCDNDPMYIITWLGLAKAGVVVALVNFNILTKALIHSINIAGCVGVIFGQDQTENIEAVRSDLSSHGINVLASIGDVTGTPAINMLQAMEQFPKTPVDAKARRGYIKDGSAAFGYIYTSGTTGLPKACKISHLKLVGMSLLPAIFNVTEKDIIYGSGMPLYHSAANLGVLACVRYGATYVVRKKFSARNHWKDCIKHKVTVMQYIGELCRYLLAAPVQPEEKKHCIRMAMGNGLRPEIWNDFQKRNNIREIGEFYGATEGNGASFNFCRNYEGQGAVGRAGAIFSAIRPMIVVEFDVENEIPIRDKKTGFCIKCPNGKSGELICPIKMIPTATGMAPDFEGYTDKAATEKKILRDVFTKGDAYFRTGDLLRKDDNGYLYFVDRIGDTFRWKGENVSTMEVSEVLSSFPGITEASVYGVPVPGKDGAACMVAINTEENAQLDPTKFATYCRANLPSYSIPLFIRFLTDMDSTGTFKHKKGTYKKEGFDPAKVSEKMWWYNATSRTFEVLDTEAHKVLVSGRAKL